MDALVAAVARRVAAARSIGFVRVLNSDKGHRVERAQKVLRRAHAARQLPKERQLDCMVQKARHEAHNSH